MINRKNQKLAFARPFCQSFYFVILHSDFVIPLS